MDYNLDRKIRFEASPKFEGLYKWALQETDDAGNVIGRDLIPWTLSLSFIAHELTLTESTVADNKYDTGRTWIRAQLRPSRHRWRSPSYSMFGTERTIDEIALFITPVDPDAESTDNQASVSGHISYTSDDPLFGGTEPDYLQFNLAVSRGEFDRLASRIALKQIETATFRCQAQGFYSEWTPDIETDHFKVLTSYDKEQQVEVPEGSEIEPPRLGKIWDVSFSIQQTVGLAPPADESGGENDATLDDEPGDTLSENRGGNPTPANAMAMYSAIRAELKTVKMLVAAMTLILLLRSIVS